MLYTSIFAIRKLKSKRYVFGKFGKQHLFEDGYDYRYIDNIAAGDKIEESSQHLRYCNSSQPIYAGYDAGPFSSMVFAQRDKLKREFRIIKDMHVYHPDQQDALAKKINDFFKSHKRKRNFCITTVQLISGILFGKNIILHTKKQP